MKDLQARKALLVVESEVYRQTLRLDVQNARLYTIRMQQKWAAYAALKPLVLAGLPIASALFSRRKEEGPAQPKSFLSMVMTGWRTYQRLQPVIASLISNFMAQKEAAAASAAGVSEVPEDAPYQPADDTAKEASDAHSASRI